MPLIDEILPRYDFRERHTTTARAPSGLLLDCVAHLRAHADPLIRTAVRLREMPAKWMGHTRARPFDLNDFTFLGRDGDKSMAFGLTGAFWQANYGLLDVRTLEAFKAVDRTDVCQLVMGFAATPTASGDTLLSTETRVFCPTPEIWRKFAPYWYLIRPVSGLIRRRMLARVRREAEATAALA
ncbi:hypothetical protein [Pandoraea pnomenusa]|uniref:hypothetical protein n=1 Tax=Pandoraea pnomenusa TaxID=93220 RepID=UPI00333F7C6C